MLVISWLPRYCAQFFEGAHPSNRSRLSELRQLQLSGVALSPRLYEPLTLGSRVPVYLFGILINPVSLNPGVPHTAIYRPHALPLQVLSSYFLVMTAAFPAFFRLCRVACTIRLGALTRHASSFTVLGMPIIISMRACRFIRLVIQVAIARK